MVTGEVHCLFVVVRFPGSVLLWSGIFAVVVAVSLQFIGVLVSTVLTLIGVSYGCVTGPGKEHFVILSSFHLVDSCIFERSFRSVGPADTIWLLEQGIDLVNEELRLTVERHINVPVSRSKIGRLREKSKSGPRRVRNRRKDGVKASKSTSGRCSLFRWWHWSLSARVWRALFC